MTKIKCDVCNTAVESQTTVPGPIPASWYLTVKCHGNTERYYLDMHAPGYDKPEIVFQPSNTVDEDGLVVRRPCRFDEPSKPTGTLPPVLPGGEFDSSIFPWKTGLK